jgi:hypothetical protein
LRLSSHTLVPVFEQFCRLRLLIRDPVPASASPLDDTHMPMIDQPVRYTRSLQSVLSAAVVAAAVVVSAGGAAFAQSGRANDAYRPPADSQYGAPAQDGSGQGGYAGAPQQGTGTPGVGGPGGGYGQNTYGQPQTYGGQRGYGGAPSGQPYGQPAPYGQTAAQGGSYGQNPGNGPNRSDDSYRAPRQDGYGEPYSLGPTADEAPPPPPRSYQNRDDGRPTRGYYTQGEITEKGRGFFGAISQGLASAIEYTYQKAGRPNGYILGEDGGGAFFAGLRYGEGMLYTKDAGDHKVFWQGPSLGYDIGGEGSKVMVLVYNMTDPGDIYHRFGGVEGSAYLVGGVSVQFQVLDNVTLAVIRSGVGLRLGANIGYVKYTRSPTWNPF